MALKGQGDPRWIVETREDGRNVNNWHWVEADFTAWVKNRLTELLSNLKLENEIIIANTRELNLNGEVSVNSRKQKTIFFYELDVSLKWEGQLKSDLSNSVKGNVQIPYISDENSYDDFEIKISVENESTPSTKVKEEFERLITPILKEAVPKMLRELREVGQEKTKLPSKSVSSRENNNSTTTSIPASSTIVSSTHTSAPSVQGKLMSFTSNEPLRTCSFVIKEKFVCSAQDLFWCLVDPIRVRAYAGQDAIIAKEKGSKFRLFNGYIEGENTEVDIPKKLVQKWRMNTWPEGHYSTVIMELTEKGGKTHLTLTHSGVPERDKEHTENGWSNNFWTRIKGIFGFGSIL